ncbi:hypothetical protein MC885_013465 [Smutsia gigantea]|nr:hypothetical protein MC885_013465 [Smutsia gigantea]
MKVLLGLLLPCLLAEVWPVPGLTPAPQLPEAQAQLTPTAQNGTGEEDGDEEARDEENSDEQNGDEEAGEEEAEEPWLTASGQQLSEETSNFGFSLLRKISMRHDGNVVFSPLGLSMAMAALMLGATGQTEAQLKHGPDPQALNQSRPVPRQALFKQLRDSLSHNWELGLTQRSFAFIQEDFDVKETFLNLSKSYFDTECVTMNFHNASQAKRLMNQYIKKETQGKIPKLFDEINPDTKLILVDYILLKGYSECPMTFCKHVFRFHRLKPTLTTYNGAGTGLDKLCRGKWLTPFDPVFTEEDTFHLDKYQAVKVPMMYRAGKFASTFDKNFHCHILKLPYRGNATMLVVLMEKMVHHYTYLYRRRMEVFFPKFKLEQKYEMHELLKQMGIRKIFSPWADLSKLSVAARNLRVSKVLQRAAIEINEKGTEAVVGTLSEIIAYSMPPIIKVDRPFHFMIYEETSRMLLFLGRVVNPTLL